MMYEPVHSVLTAPELFFRHVVWEQDLASARPSQQRRMRSVEGIVATSYSYIA
jgi:hypothetical protein